MPQQALGLSDDLTTIATEEAKGEIASDRPIGSGICPGNRADSSPNTTSLD